MRDGDECRDALAGTLFASLAMATQNRVVGGEVQLVGNAKSSVVAPVLLRLFRRRVKGIG